MKTTTILKLALITLFSSMILSTGQASQKQLKDCSRESNPQLCMSKVLLKAIQRGRRSQRGPQSHYIGKVKFYNGYGNPRCSGKELGFVRIIWSRDKNQAICKKTEEFYRGNYRLGVELLGEKFCFDLRYHDDMTAACNTALLKAGL